MTHIQLEIQTSVPTKRSLVIMLKPGHPSNVTLEAVQCPSTGSSSSISWASARALSRFQGVSLLIRFQWKGAQQCAEEHPGPTSRQHLAVSRIWHLVSGCI